MARHAVIVAGFGYRSGATVESLRDAYARTGQAALLLATVTDKLPLLDALARDLRLPTVGIDAAELEAQVTETRSETVLKARGTGSVAEAAALAAAGPGARLIAPRVVSTDGRATCALARANAPRANALGEDE